MNWGGLFVGQFRGKAISGARLSKSMVSFVVTLHIASRLNFFVQQHDLQKIQVKKNQGFGLKNVCSTYKYLGCK